MLQFRRPGSFRVLILQGDGDGRPPPNRGRVLVVASPTSGGPEPQQSIARHGPLLGTFPPGRDRPFRRPVDAESRHVLPSPTTGVLFPYFTCRGPHDVVLLLLQSIFPFALLPQPQPGGARAS